MNISQYFSSTMLLERLIGVFSYCFFVFVGYFLIKNKRTKTASFFVIAGLTILAFFYIPGNDADLKRISEMIVHWKDTPFDVFLKQTIASASTPIAYLFYYLISCTGILGLLPALCALTFYMNVFHIILKIENSGRYSGKSLAIAFLLFMSSGSFLEVISDVRCFVSFSLIMRAIFDESYCHKSLIRHLPLYVIASLIHPAALALTILWFLFTAFIRRQSFIKKVTSILTIVLLSGIAYYLRPELFFDMFNKASSFLGGETYSYLWEYIIGFIQLICFVYLIIKLSKNGRRQFKDLGIMQFASVLCLICLILFFEYNIFHRFITAVSFLLIPIAAEICQNYYLNDDSLSLPKKKDMFITKNANLLFLFSLLILFIACVRGNLCGFKFFLLG